MAATADPVPAEQNHILAFTCQAYTNTNNLDRNGKSLFVRN